MSGLGEPGLGSRPQNQSGYTLIEVIVAFALLALALTLLLGTLSGSAKQVRRSADAGQAALHAQSLLDQVGVGVALQPGRRDGDFEDGKYRWSLDIAAYVDPARPPSPLLNTGAARLLSLSLAVEWGDGEPGQQLRLRSLRLVAPDINANAAPPL
ncbi:MAG: type II secretion system protein XpsI [Luteimonas sp.]